MRKRARRWTARPASGRRSFRGVSIRAFVERDCGCVGRHHVENGPQPAVVGFPGRDVEKLLAETETSIGGIDEQPRHRRQALSATTQRRHCKVGKLVGPDRVERNVTDDAFVYLAHPGCEAVLGDNEARDVVLQENRVAVTQMDIAYETAKRFHVGAATPTDLHYRQSFARVLKTTVIGGRGTARSTPGWCRRGDARREPRVAYARSARPSVCRT